MVVHKKILELKSKAAPINYRNLSVNEFGQLVSDYSDSLDKRVVKGYVVRWGEPNAYGEVFLKGSFAKSISERGPGTNGNYEIKFLNQHRQVDPLSLFAVLREDDYGLYFETVPLDAVDSADRVLTQLRSKTLNNFSIGFDYIWEQMEYDEKRNVVIIKEAILYEISVVSIPADMGSYAMRSQENMTELLDDTEDFIETLPRKLRMQAREIFARHKALVVSGPPQHSEAPADEEPQNVIVQPRKLNLNYLIENL